MPTKLQIDQQLKIASEALKKELYGQDGLRGLRLEKKHQPWNTNTLGRGVDLAAWGNKRPSLQLWLDRGAGQDVYRFWYGFWSDTEEKMRNLLEQLPKELTPRGKPYTEEDWDRLPDSKNYVLKEPNESKLTRPFFECYKKWGNFFFGMYDWGGHGSKNKMQLATWPAATFIKNVVWSVSEDREIESLFDEEHEGFEGEQKKRFILHRTRERKLRKQKIRETLRLNGKLVCEVQNCGFDFAERYGKLGKGYAQVHHNKPLSSAPRQGMRVTLKDLAIVCANCHVMIHHGGKCRSLDALIPSSANGAANSH